MKRIIVGLLVVLILLGLIGCGSIYNSIPEETNNEAENAEQSAASLDNEDTDGTDKEVYYTVGMHIILPYWQDHRLGLETAAKELGVDVVFTGGKR